MDHPKDKTNCVTAKLAVLIGALDTLPCNVINAIKIKISSPAYKLPNNRSAKEIGLASPFSPRTPISDRHCFFKDNSARINMSRQNQDDNACQDGDTEFMAKRQNSAVALRRLSTRYLFGGIGIISLTAYLAFSLGVAIPPVGIRILMVVGAIMIGYGFYLEHCRADVVAQKSYSEDVQPFEPRIESCWEKFCRI